MSQQLRLQAEYDVLTSLGVLPEKQVLDKEASYSPESEALYTEYFQEVVDRVSKVANIDPEEFNLLKNVVLDQHQTITNLQGAVKGLKLTQGNPKQIAANAASLAVIGTLAGDAGMRLMKKKWDAHKANKSFVATKDYSHQPEIPSLDLEPQESGKYASVNIAAISKITKRLDAVEKQALRNSKRPISDLIAGGALGGATVHMANKFLEQPKN